MLRFLSLGQWRRSLVMLPTVLIGACLDLDGLTGPESAIIRAFAVEEGVVPIHELEVILEFNRPRTVVFRVEWGNPLPPIDCLGECAPWFARLSGLLFADRIGWLDRRADPDSLTLFDFLAADAFLTSARMFEAMASANELFFQQTYKNLLVRDPDTPLAGLRRIAEGLYEWISPWLAELLLDHPVGGRDCETIELIARVPVFQGDAYSDVRARAQAIRRILRC